MWPRKTALHAVFWTLYFLIILPHEAQTSGVFELQIRSFRNDLGLTANGTCCNGFRKDGICSESCHTYFKVCLAHYQADIATNPNPRCTFANYTTPVLGDNTMEFSLLSELPVQDARQNTLYFPVENFQWPGDFSLIIEAWHETSLDSPNQGPVRRSVLISRLATIRTTVSGEAWSEFEETFEYGAKLRYAFRFQCNQNYYGPKCSTLCRPRDNEFGHLTCSPNGTMVCMEGWGGEYCDTALCLPECDHNNGFCDRPNECQCKLGWQGPYCTECVPYLGCHHGTCEEPWECNCEEGWGGLLCNQDLNFCTHHNPCKNEGVCRNTGQGSYTCDCRPGYKGDNCEQEINDCKNMPCVNGGLCKDIGNGFQCQCPQSHYGARCEKEAVSCLGNPCEQGTCVNKEGTYFCICPAGYTGPNCETDINECESSPCQHGTCVDQLNGYRCICQPGYVGSECHELEYNCVDNPCGEHGYCVNEVNSYRCQCHAGYVGANCMENVDDCDMRPCANGGSCTDLVNDFKCDCAPGFEGKDCSFLIDLCRENPCRNGGICESRLADYICSCPTGFWGKNCHLYEGMPVNVDVVDNKNKNNITARPPAPATTPGNGDLSGQMDSSTGEKGEGGGGDGLSMTQLLVIVCLGVGIPLILIIIAVTILLCRKRSYLQQRQHTQQNLENMAREKERHYINNMNNKSSTTVSSNLSSPTSDANIFTTLPNSASNSSSIKISNEEQQDINKLKAKHMMLAGDCGLTTSYTTKDIDSSTSGNGGGGGGGGGGGSTLTQHVSSGGSQRTHTPCPSYLRDVVAITHKELCLQSPSPPFSSPPSVLPSSSACPPSQGGRRGSDCDLDFEKTYRRLDVDSLQVDTKRPLSEYQRHHSQHKKGTAISPPQVPLDVAVTPSNISTINTVSGGSGSSKLCRDTSSTPAYNSPTTVYLGGYNSSLPSLTPKQQQLLQEQLKRHSRYDEDFLATEV